MKSNYEIMVEQSARQFLEYDQKVMIARFDLLHDAQTISIDFFGSRYHISRETGEVTRSDGTSAKFNEVLSIYDVLCYSKEDAHLSGEWITITSLHPQSNFGSTNSLYSRLEELFEGRVDELKEACETLGGIQTTKSDIGYQFQAFPFLPIIFQFWDKDEDFGGKINYLFDVNTLDYLHFETAWYVADHLGCLLKEQMGLS